MTTAKNEVGFNTKIVILVGGLTFGGGGVKIRWGGGVY